MNSDQQKTMDITSNSKQYYLQAHAYLKHELSMDDGQATNILNTLSVPLKTSFEAVKKAYEAHDLKILAETAHSLKGALLNMGLNELAELAKTIEESSAKGESVEYTERLVYLHDALQYMTDEIAS